MSNLRGKPRHEPVSDVLRQLSTSVELALAAGIPWEHLILDPGFGFGLAGAENLRVLSRLREVRALGRPLLIGTSRKAHIGLVLGTPVDDRRGGHGGDRRAWHRPGRGYRPRARRAAMARVVRMSDAVVRGWQEGTK